MERKIALIFPGQGAQYVGMGKDFYDGYSFAKETFQEAEDFLQMKLSTILFEGPDDELKKTLHSQLGIYINSVAIYRVVKSQFPELSIDTCSGLSLGEYSALFASGKMTFSDGLSLVKKRAELMTGSCKKHPGTMAAVLGLSGDVVEEIVIKLQAEGLSIWAANFNSPGQVVISGTEEGVLKASEELKVKGAKRIVPLTVEGAFHSGLMQDAQDELTPFIRELLLHESLTRLVMNVTGNFVVSSEEIKDNLIKQVTSSTRWEQSVKCMDQAGITTFVELGCGKTLTSMNKKIVPQKESISVDNIKNLDQLKTIC